ncbi:hypothetical protein Trydic_g19636 [Trypoxylus dichotomus]
MCSGTDRPPPAESGFQKRPESQRIMNSWLTAFAAQQNTMFVFEDVTGLVFDEPGEPHNAQFVEESAENEEDWRRRKCY